MEDSRFPLHIPLVLTFQGYNTKQVSPQIDFAPVLPLGLSHSPYLVIFDSVPVPILLYLTVSNFCFRRKEASHTESPILQVDFSAWFLAHKKQLMEGSHWTSLSHHLLFLFLYEADFLCLLSTWLFLSLDFAIPGVQKVVIHLQHLQMLAYQGIKAWLV